MSEQPPKTPGTPRPGNQPYYIDTECSDCNAELEKFDEEWHDEWICPECEALYLDIPPEEAEKLLQTSETTQLKNE